MKAERERVENVEKWKVDEASAERKVWMWNWEFCHGALCPALVSILRHHSWNPYWLYWSFNKVKRLEEHIFRVFYFPKHWNNNFRSSVCSQSIKRILDRLQWKNASRMLTLAELLWFGLIQQHNSVIRKQSRSDWSRGKARQLFSMFHPQTNSMYFTSAFSRYFQL